MSEQESLLINICGINVNINGSYINRALLNYEKAHVNFKVRKTADPCLNIFFKYTRKHPFPILNDSIKIFYLSWSNKYARIEYKSKQKELCVTYYGKQYDLSPADIVGLIFQGVQYVALNCYDGLMLHAAAIIIKSKCFVLLGEPNAGKSTIAKHCFNKYGINSVLCDDIIYLNTVFNRLTVYGTPWVGRKTKNEGEKLSANIKKGEDKDKKNIVFLVLNKSIKENRIVSMSKIGQIKHLLNSLFHNIRLLPLKSRKKAINRLFDLFENIEIKELRFKKGPSVIDFLANYKP